MSINFLPAKRAAALEDEIRERQSKINFEKSQIEKAQEKKSLNLVTLLVEEQGDDGIYHSDLMEWYKKEIDCPEEIILEEIEESIRKNWIIRYAGASRELTYYATERLYKLLGVI